MSDSADGPNHCGCACHHTPGVAHFIACCHAPPAVPTEPALALRLEVIRLRAEVQHLRTGIEGLSHRDPAASETTAIRNYRCGWNDCASTIRQWLRSDTDEAEHDPGMEPWVVLPSEMPEAPTGDNDE